MDGMHDGTLLTDAAMLRELYGTPSDGAIAKEIDYVHPHYRSMIEASPFMVMATSGPDGLDVSPRGDPVGFVVVQDERTLLIPDRRGNNRADSLSNLIADPRIALLFLIPGVGETLRVNGRAEISIDPVLLERFPAQGKLPRVYFQCPKALVRSDLWNPEKHVERRKLPSSGTILADITRGRVGGPEYDAAYPERLRATIY
jgi:uncharacterized protein